MRTRVQAEQVRLITMADVDLEGRNGKVVLPKHTAYAGMKKQLAVRFSRRNVRWTPVEYTLSVSPASLSSDEAPHPDGENNSYDVSRYVQLGLIIVRECDPLVSSEADL